MMQEIHEGGGCLRLLLSAIVLAIIAWFLLSLVLMTFGQLVDGWT